MKKNVLLVIAAFGSVATFAQDSVSNVKTSDTSTSTRTPFLNLTGSVDAYYRYDFRNPKTAPNNSLTSFTRSSNSFELGMASLRADHSFGKVSATIDLGFGRRAEDFAYNDQQTRLALKQVYVTYEPSKAIKFTLGSWATHVGYEMVDAYLNRNYSMSYMFTNGPFTHTGVKADITLGGKSAVMLGLSNPTDFRTAPGMPKSFIGQFSTASKNDKLKLYVNFVGGKQNDQKKTVQGDVVASYAVSSQFSLGFNATLQSNKLDTGNNGNFKTAAWSGAALYINYDPIKWFGLTLRTEYIDDKDEYLGLKHAFAPTLSANFKIDNLTIIPEFRFDKAGTDVFYKTATTNANSTGNILFAVVYHF
jgi:Putative beta-barrel porin-2, OmpL-like. bbp2